MSWRAWLEAAKQGPTLGILRYTDPTWPAVPDDLVHSESAGASIRAEGRTWVSECDECHARNRYPSLELAERCTWEHLWKMGAGGPLRVVDDAGLRSVLTAPTLAIRVYQRKRMLTDVRRWAWACSGPLCPYQHGVYAAVDTEAAALAEGQAHLHEFHT